MAEIIKEKRILVLKMHEQMPLKSEESGNKQRHKQDLYGGGGVFHTSSDFWGALLW